MVVMYITTHYTKSFSVCVDLSQIPNSIVTHVHADLRQISNSSYMVVMHIHHKSFSVCADLSQIPNPSSMCVHESVRPIYTCYTWS